jgi:hypothetical protein
MKDLHAYTQTLNCCICIKTILLYNRDAFILAHYKRDHAFPFDHNCGLQTDLSNMAIASKERVSMLI